MILAPLRIHQRRVIPARRIYQGALLSHLGLNLLDVIEIVGESGVNLRERDGRNVRNDLVRGKTLVLLPSDDVQHADSVASNMSPAAADAWRLHDPLAGGAVHS